jgi:SagB-type dehydrogenase family enzyme
MSMEDDSVIVLPAPQLRGELSVEEALHARRSVREYADSALTLAEVSQVLWAAYGVTMPIPDGPGFLRGGLKTAPSAGALYPLEVYVVAGHVGGLDAGVYRYKPEAHELHKVVRGDVRDELCRAAWGQDMVKRAPASIVYSAVFERTTGKYGTRGRERYVCMDLGHSAENVYLQCAALGLSTCAIGAFDDAAVKRVVGMPDAEEPLYIMPVGRLLVGE